MSASWLSSECLETFESILALGTLAIFESTLTLEFLAIPDWIRKSWPCPSSFVLSLTTTGMAFQIPGELLHRSWVFA